MQTRSFVFGAVATALLAGSASAQGALSTQCAAQIVVTRDACQKAVDLYNFMAPQLGSSITGGNAVLGSASTLGGLGHFTIGVRANVLLQGQLPQTQNVQLSLTGERSSDFAPKQQYLGLPTADAAIGIFRGVNLGMTNVGGVDALVSAFYVPDVDEDAVKVKPTSGRLKLGYGARVGILQETAVVPGISVSYLRRDLPTVDLRAGLGTGDSVRVTGFKETTSAWRLAASKNLVIFGLTAGIGQDTYDSEATAGVYIAPRAGVPITVNVENLARPSQKLTRTNMFAGASLNLALLRIAGEIGRVSGGEVTQSYNTFGGKRADDPYTYASLGLRLGF